LLHVNALTYENIILPKLQPVASCFETWYAEYNSL